MEALSTDSRDLLLPALEQSSIAVVLVDEADTVLFFNAAAELLWGHGRAEVLGRDVRRLVPDGLEQAVAGADGSVQSPVAGAAAEVSLLRRDGSRFWGLLALSRIEVGAATHRLVFVRDVSCEVATREEHHLLLAAADHTDRVIMVLDRDREIVYVNRAFTDLFGHTPQQAIGRVPTELLHSPRAEPGALQRLQENFWRHTPFQEEILAADRDGRDVWVRVSANPILEPDSGRLRNLVVVLADATQDREIHDLERDVLAALACGQSFPELGDYLCRRIEAVMPGVVVALACVEDGRLHSWAAPHLTPEYAAAVDGLPVSSYGFGAAAHQGKPVWVPDIAADPLWAGHSHLVLPLGLGACRSYPIEDRNGAVAGTVIFYFRDGRTPDLYLDRVAGVAVHLCALAIQREASRREMARLLQFDTLTGLPNRHQLHRTIRGLIAAPAAEAGIAFLCLDLDRFADINDTLGHDAGDQVLVQVAERLRLALRPGEVIGRLQGDLFGIVASGLDSERVPALAERLMEAVAAPVEVAGHRLQLSASVGVSVYPEASGDHATVMAKAERAMAEVKASGGNDYRFVSQEMNLIARDRLLLGAALQRALSTGVGLQLHYQPQVSVETGELHGVEALARWHDPDFGTVPPDRFIRLAEEIGVIDAIGRWALREACRQLAAWRSTGIEVPAVSVNLSAYNFRSLVLSDYLAGLLAAFNLPGESLVVEMTESTMPDLTPEMLEAVHAIRALGVGLSVDDFGTGFSTLSTLANLPVTELKIDRGFMDKALEDPRVATLVTAMLGIGASLGLTVVAEGVETEDQHAMLAQHGCGVIQGYLYSRPLPPEELPGWLAGRAT